MNLFNFFMVNMLNRTKQVLKNFFFLFFIFECASQSSNTESIFLSSNRLVLGDLKLKTASLDLGDIDGDGDIDIVVANGRHWPAQNQVFFNNGFGIFTVSTNLGALSSTSYSTELGDFDDDGDLDIAVGNDRAPNKIYENDGLGNFKFKGNFGSMNSPTRNIVLSDIDQDNDLDILITNRGYINEICLNDGIVVAVYSPTSNCHPVKLI